MRVEHEIAPSAQLVGSIVVDLDRSPTVISGIDHIERLTQGSGFEVGTRWRETRTTLGRQATEHMVVTAIDPGHSDTVVAAGGGTDWASADRRRPTSRQNELSAGRDPAEHEEPG